MTDSQDTPRRVPRIVYRQQMGPLLLGACPSFEPQWKQFLADWISDGPDLPLYILWGDFARHLSGLLLRGDDETLRRVFEVVELFIIEGDSYVSEAAIVGILEDLQNTNLHSGTKPEHYLPFLLPQSRRWWEKVELFWKDGKLLTDD